MKSYRVTVTAEAKTDLRRIKAHIVRTSGLVESAERIIRELAARLRDLEALPHQGTQRDDIRTALRLLPHHKAVVAFEIEERSNCVRILRLFYGGEDIASVFADPEDKDT